MSGSSPRSYVKETRHRDQMLQEEQETDDDLVKKLDRIAYRFFSDAVNERQELVEDYQTTLKAAYMAVGSDLYLSRIVLYTILMSTFGLFIGGMVGLAALSLGTVQELVGVQLPVAVVLAFMGTVLISIVFGGLTALLGYIYPSYKANRRKTAIDSAMPSAVTFMYALNRGGMSLPQVFEIIADSEDTYGEVSREMQTVMNEIDMRSLDLMQALRKSGRRTPSPKFSDFVDDMLATLDSGADMTSFLSDKADEMIEDAKRDQANFIQTLELMSEVYVTAIVAGPLFLIVIQVVMSMIGGSSDPSQLDGIVYGLLPFMNIAFFFLIDFLAGADEKVSDEIPLKDNTRERSDKSIEDFVDESDNEQVQKVYEAKQKRERTALLRQPVTELLHNPDITLLFTVPLAILEIITVLVIGAAEPSISAFIAAPMKQTGLLILGPLFTMAVPLSVFHEITSRRESKMMKRLPDALKQLASANAVGMTLTESLDTTAENTTGRLGDEFESVRNDVKWNHDANSALIKFANRVQVPIVTRTVKLITEANESTGDIEDVLEVAAKNVESQYRLEQERSQTMLMYTAVLLISFGVYLFVIFILDSEFLTKIADISAGGGGGGGAAGGGGGGFELSDLPIDRFRMVFYHSTIVQSFASGMIAGFLKTNDIRSGLKFAIILSSISTAVFAFL